MKTIKLFLCIALFFWIGLTQATVKTKRHIDERKSLIAVTAVISPSQKFINGKTSEFILFEKDQNKTLVDDRFSFCNERTILKKNVMQVQKRETLLKRPSGV